MSLTIKYINKDHQLPQLNYLKYLPDYFKTNKRGSVLDPDLLTADLREIIRLESYEKESNVTHENVYTTEGDYKISDYAKKYVVFIKIRNNCRYKTKKITP